VVQALTKNSAHQSQIQTGCSQEFKEALKFYLKIAPVVIYNTIELGKSKDDA